MENRSVPRLGPETQDRECHFKDKETKSLRRHMIEILWEFCFSDILLKTLFSIELPGTFINNQLALSKKERIDTLDLIKI